MSVRFARRRTALRAALTTVAVTGAVLVPASGAFAAPAQTPATTKGCTVTKSIPSVFEGLTAVLTNSPAGPSAVLKDAKGKIHASVDRKHLENADLGFKITDAYTASPKLLDRTEGGVGSKYRVTAFPALPKGCSGESGTSHANCTVTKTFPSVFEGLTVVLTNSPDGPSAVLKDAKGKIHASVDRKHPENAALGFKISGAYSSTPKLLDRTQGGSTPYRVTAFPALAKSCVKAPGTTPTGSQTKTLPKGGVAAGAEGVGANHDSTLIVAGGAAAAAGAAGLGFVVLRRRSAGAAA